MQKIRKILLAVSEKTALPTNQPTKQPTKQPTSQLMVCAKRRHHLIKELENIKFSSSIENATANKVTTKCKKQ